jgi:hypothetical protein
MLAQKFVCHGYKPCPYIADQCITPVVVTSGTSGTILFMAGFLKEVGEHLANVTFLFCLIVKKLSFKLVL